MNTIFAYHEHELKPDADRQRYEKEVKHAITNLKIIGLIKAIHLHGFKGTRKNKYAILWIFKDKESLELNFGTEEHPKLPDDWKYYENEALAKFLDRDPDKIVFTDYDVLNEFSFSD